MFGSRRRFILIGLLTTCWVSLGRLWGKAPPADADVANCLKAWVEHLIPTDAVSPGAGQLNVHLDLLELAEARPSFRRLLWAGVVWLEREAQSAGAASFVDLSDEWAEAIVAKAAEMPPRTLPRVFFERSFSVCKERYYAKPESWGGLGMARPPQPFGYMDYTKGMP